MQRLNDTFLATIDAKLNLQDKHVLEIGCGNGKKSIDLASVCAALVAIDPSTEALTVAKRDYSAQNLAYHIGHAQDLKFSDNSFDVAIFSLSLHHVPMPKMAKAIWEAARVVRPGGRVVFLEPTFNGSFFDTEIDFGASDSDERKEKAAAYFAMLNSNIFVDEIEYYDQVTFVFESDQDFIDNMEPQRHLDKVSGFLEDANYTLHAQRRINIFSVA